MKTKLDTNGASPDVLRKLIGKGLIAFVAMDIKTQVPDSSPHVWQDYRAPVEM